jgi:HAD superfamily hydrolase (TIGR01509 family)
MTILQAMLFDVDGTLIDTEELHRQAFNLTFLELRLGWDWSVNLYAQLLSVSGGADRIARYIDLIDLPAGEKTRLRRVIPQIHRMKTKAYGRLIGSSSAKLRPGVARLIDEGLRKGHRIGLAATSASENVQTIVSTALGFEAFSAVEAIVCADQVSRKKPAPDIYELLLTQLRTPATSAVAFEDSANGLTAAKTAGLYTVVTPTCWTKTQSFEGADLVLPSLGEPTDPLEPSVAERIGGSFLSIAELESLMRSRSRPIPRLREA